MGKLLHLPIALSLLTMPVIIYHQEWFAVVPFMGMGLGSLAIGQLLYHTYKTDDDEVSGWSMLFVAFAWLLMALFSILAFWGTSYFGPNDQFPALQVFRNPVNGFFESMSGFTGTGLTMVEDPSQLPFTLQWWRAFSEWIGGVGVIMLAAVLLDLKHGEQKVYRAEARQWKIEKLSMTATIKRIWSIYLIFTILSIVTFYLLGMPAWEALNHGMTAIGTGGFAVTPESFTHYSAGIKGAAVVIMLVGAVSFKIHYWLLFRGEVKKILSQTQLRYFAVLFVVAVPLLFWLSPSIPLIDVLFQAASALGTCGLNTVEISHWPIAPLFLIILLILMGGNAGSTAGGLKTERLAWLLKGCRQELKQILSAKSTRPPITINGERVEDTEAEQRLRKIGNLFFLWILCLFLGTLGLAMTAGEGYGFSQLLFDAASALSNVGLSAGVTGDGLPASSKLILIMLMWLGRLEIVAVLVLLLAPFQKQG